MSEVDPLDLSNLQLQPDWVKQPQEKPKFKEESVRPPGGGKGRGKGGYGGGDRRGGQPQGRRDDNRRGGPGGGRRDGGQRSGQGQGQGQRRDGGRGGQAGRGGKGGPGGRGGQRRDFQDRDRRPQQDPLPKNVSLVFQPAREGVAFIAQQIKASGCAYPVFDLARLILNNRDRYSLIFESKGDAKFHLCKLDSSLWLNREQAVAHATTCKEFGDYYKEEQVTVDPPKGNFSSIAVCGLSGRLLGPPNHHSYQENIVRIHAERYARMHIDGYKRKIKIERGEEIVEKWKEQESTQAQFTLLKSEEGAEPVVLKSRQEAIRHFSQHFAASMITEVKKATLPGDITGRQLSPALFNLLRQEGEQLRKFPMDLVQRLCRAFEKQGLKFFKEGKKTTYVSRLRPRQITNEEKFSDGIRKIVTYVRSHPNTKLNDLAGHLIPESKRSTPAPKPKKKKSRRRSGRKRQRPTTKAFTIWILPHRPKQKPRPEQPQQAPRSKAFTIWTKPPAVKVAKPAEKPAVERTKAFSIWTLPHLPKPAPKPAATGNAKPGAPALTQEEIAVLQDLRWLIREGYVIEFSNGTLKLPREHEKPKKKAAKKKVATPETKKPEKPADTKSAPQATVYPKPNCAPTSAPPAAK